MARRRRNSQSGNKNIVWILLGAVAVVVVLAVLFSSVNSADTSGSADRDFKVADYRKGGSRITNNRYRLEGRLEGVMTRGNDRLVVVTLPNNPDDERLPLLVPEGAAGGVNLARGKTYIFSVECRNGQDAEGQPINGILITREVENKL